MQRPRHLRVTLEPPEQILHAARLVGHTKGGADPLANLGSRAEPACRHFRGELLLLLGRQPGGLAHAALAMGQDTRPTAFVTIPVNPALHRAPMHPDRGRDHIHRPAGAQQPQPMQPHPALAIGLRPIGRLQRRFRVLRRPVHHEPLARHPACLRTIFSRSMAPSAEMGMTGLSHNSSEHQCLAP